MYDLDWYPRSSLARPVRMARPFKPGHARSLGCTGDLCYYSEPIERILS